MTDRWTSLWLLGHLAAIGTIAGPVAASDAGRPAQTASSHADREGEGLHLKRYLSEVLALHPKLLASQHKASSAEAAVMTADGAFDLKLYASGSHAPLGTYDKTHTEVGLTQPTRVWGTELWARYENGADYPPYDGGSVTSEWGRASLGVLLPILQDGAIDARRYAALESEIQRDIAEHGVRQTQGNLLADAAHSWWKWCILGHKVRIYDTLLKQAEERQEMLEELVRVGALAPLETIDNQRTILSRRAKQLGLAAEFRAAGLRVGLYRRSRDGTPRAAAPLELPAIPIPGHPPANEISRVDQELELSPVVSISRSILSALEQELRLAKNQQLPRLDLSVAASHSAGDTRPYSPLSSSVSETTLGGNLKLSLDVQRRKARGKAAELRAKRRQVEEELRLAMDTLRIDVLAAHQVLDAQYQAVQQSREATNLARQVAQAEADSLLAGQSTVMSVNIREQAVLTAEIAELEAIHLLQSAWIEMQRARGKTKPLEFMLPGARSEGEVQEP